MVSDAVLIRFVCQLLFRAADKFFRYVSWMGIIVVLHYAQLKTGSQPIKIVSNLALMLFSSSLFLQAMYLGSRDPETLGVPEGMHGISKVVQVVVGIAFACALASPALYLDAIIAALIEAKP